MGDASPGDVEGAGYVPADSLRRVASGRRGRADSDAAWPPCLTIGNKADLLPQVHVCPCRTALRSLSTQCWYQMAAGAGGAGGA